MQLPPGRSLLAGSGDLLLWSGAAAALLGTAALLSIWLGRYHSLRAKLIWTGVTLFLPVVGPLAWFILGQERRRDRRAGGQAGRRAGRR